MKSNKRNLAEIALEKLNVDISKYNIILKYHGKFNSFNGNVRKHNDTLTFNISKRMRKIDREIQMGLIHELAKKILPE